MKILKRIEAVSGYKLRQMITFRSIIEHIEQTVLKHFG